VSLLLAACGGDDAPSREDFASEADRICREVEKELEKLGESADSPEEIADAIDEVIEETRQAAKELVDLERPEGAAADTSPPQRSRRAGERLPAESGGRGARSKGPISSSMGSDSSPTQKSPSRPAFG
jgi:hypothetical protein